MASGKRTSKGNHPYYIVPTPRAYESRPNLPKTLTGGGDKNDDEGCPSTIDLNKEILWDGVWKAQEALKDKSDAAKKAVYAAWFWGCFIAGGILAWMLKIPEVGLSSNGGMLCGDAKNSGARFVQ